ncbi:MAG: peptidoglycan DD-metalloendopeptidase family protein [Bacteroidota bacterium]
MSTEKPFYKNRLNTPEKTPYFQLGLLIFCLAAVALAYLSTSQPDGRLAASSRTPQAPHGAFDLIEPTLQYGFALDTFQVHRATIANNEFLSDILTRHKVEYQKIDQLARNSKGIFDVRNLRAGRPYTILSRDTSQGADYFVYEPSVFKYITYDLNNGTATETSYPIETQIKTASGIIYSSLWNTMTDNGLSYELTALMEDVFAWSIDFHHIQNQDKFKLVYEEQLIDGKPVGVGKIQAAYFQNAGKDFYAFHFENTKHAGFFDLEARPMKKAFLKSPVKYSRISSRYNLTRFHPVLRRRKAHLGTDYAAPRGTPIFAVADGVVTKASRTRGNGNYVKIKHDKVYQTQYLHMQAFAKGIRPGVHVRQGETIGYVGSTGLATGPHVCFRFWKHGRQVNHLRENLPPPDPMPEGDVPAFEKVRDAFKAQLDATRFPDNAQLVVDKVDAESTQEDMSASGR